MSTFDPNDPRTLRVFVFPDRPDVLLLYVPDGQELWLPRLRTPFQRYDVAKTLGDADIPAAVRESVPGRFTHTVARALKDEKAERGQRQREHDAAIHVEIRDNPNATTYQQKRAALVLAKEKIDDELRDLKLQIGRAKSASMEGRYLPAVEFRSKEARIADLKATSLAMQRRLGDLKQQEVAEREVSSEGKMRRFIELAKGAIGEERYAKLWEQVEVEFGAKTTR